MHKFMKLPFFPLSCRNRRMFGALLGTLKRFKNDEAKQKDKVKWACLSVLAIHLYMLISLKPVFIIS